MNPSLSVPTPKSLPPRFGPLALRLLGPTLLIALLAAVTLARDYRTARAEATARARDLAELGLDRLVSRVDQFADSVSPTLPHHFAVGAANQLVQPQPLRWPPQPHALGPTSDEPNPRFPDWQLARAALDSQQPLDALRHFDRLLAATNDPPLLAPAERVRVLLERTRALERTDHTNAWIPEWQRVLEAAGPYDTTDTGLSVIQLAALRILDLVESQSAPLPTAWRQDPASVVRRVAATPSPYATDFLRGLLPHLAHDRFQADPGASVTETELAAILEGATRARELHARAVEQFPGPTPWPFQFWIEHPTSGLWLAVQSSREQPQPNGVRRFGLFPAAEIRGHLANLIHELDRREEFAVRWYLGDWSLRLDESSGAPGFRRHAAPSGPGGEGDDEVLLRRTLPVGLTLAVGVSVRDTAAFRASHRRRTLTLGGLLVATAVLAWIAVLSTHRSLLRQHQLNQQQSNFVSSVSHELRTPLGSIRLLAEGLERGAITEETRRREYFRLIAQESRRLGALIENVLDFSRIEQGRKHYDIEPTDLNALVQHTLAAFAPLAEERQVRLERDPPPAGPAIELQADGRALQQALLNLLDNALKHSPAGSSITVGIELRSDLEPDPTTGRPAGSREVRIRVRDAGPGIPAEDHRRIFEPFVRRGSELRREQQGVGIGLSIVQHIVAAHRGRIEVQSQPGQGATFTLVLPCAS